MIRHGEGVRYFHPKVRQRRRRLRFQPGFDNAEGVGYFHPKVRQRRRRSLISTQGSTTPQAFANFSPRLERSDYLGLAPEKSFTTLKGFGNWRTLSGFTSVLCF